MDTGNVASLLKKTWNTEFILTSVLTFASFALAAGHL
jgi:hypothetical protein